MADRRPDPEETDRGSLRTWSGLLSAQLRRLAGHHMRGERPGHTLQPSGLVNEAYVRMAGREDLRDVSRAQFLHAASTAMRRVLLDQARRKRGRLEAHRHPVTVSDVHEVTGLEQLDVLALEEALEEFAKLDARATEVLVMKFYGGSSHTDVAAALGVSVRTVEDDWRMARAWLTARLSDT